MNLVLERDAAVSVLLKFASRILGLANYKTVQPLTFVLLIKDVTLK